MTPRVSIVLNVRNGDAFLRETMDRVLAQSFTDWELIAWDDRSTDQSAAIIRSYRDPRIRYFLSPGDTPLGRARESAIRQARGKWLAFVDQDDLWLPDKLERQIAEIDCDGGKDLGIVYGRTVAFTSQGKERDFDIVHEFAALPEGNILVELFRGSCFIAISSAMLLRAAVEEVGGIPDQFQVSCDYFLFTEIASRYRARAVQEVVCRYRLHQSSLSHTGRSKAHQEAMLVVDRWAKVIGPRMAAWRYRVHSNVLAFDEIGQWRTLIPGMCRLALHGSILRLVTRPMARSYRAFRRKFLPPPWIVRYRDKFRVSQGMESNILPRLPAPAARTAEPAMTTLTLSVIIVNWKVCGLLRECLSTLYRETRLEPSLWETIVVDNASDDGTPEMIRCEFPAVVLQANDANVGFAKANNQAFGCCRGEYILLLNPDTIVLPGSVDRMIAIISGSPDVAALGCRLLNTDGSLQRFTGGNPPGILNVACFYLFANRLLPGRLLPPPLFLENEPADDAAVGWVSGACMLLRRKAFHDTIFDERFFMYGEDLHLCQRLGAAGWKVVYTPNVEIVHHGGCSLGLQSPALRARNLLGLREVYLNHSGFSSAWLFDLTMSMAFLIRSIAFEIASRARPGGGFGGRASASRHLLGEAVRLLLGRQAS
jgi:N-acetylglucosaminyl-diphospho-decaprenol L-rhamnosyltransferase